MLPKSKCKHCAGLSHPPRPPHARWSCLACDMGPSALALALAFACWRTTGDTKREWQGGKEPLGKAKCKCDIDMPIHIPSTSHPLPPTPAHAHPHAHAHPAASMALPEIAPMGGDCEQEHEPAQGIISDHAGHMHGLEARPSPLPPPRPPPSPLHMAMEKKRTTKP